MRIEDADKMAAKERDMVQYLLGLGYEGRRRGRIMWFSSPFARDSEPSFAVYPDQNKFKDYSTGRGGDMITLAQSLHNLSFQDAVMHILEKKVVEWKPDKYKDFDVPRKEFKLRNYITEDRHERALIRKYASARGITEGYDFGAFYLARGKEEWERTLGIMFPHVNENMEVTGAKFRNIAPKEGDARFTARGKLGLYVLDNRLKDSFEEPICYLVESESSANSLYMYFKEIKHNAVVVSHGGVGAPPENVPFDFPLKVIIDYDGNEKLYQERLSRYAHLKGTPIKMLLPKDEDLNSLWVKRKMNIVNNLLF